MPDLGKLLTVLLFFLVMWATTAVLFTHSVGLNLPLEQRQVRQKKFLIYTAAGYGVPCVFILYQLL